MTQLQACDRVFDIDAVDDPESEPELAIVIGRRDHVCGDHEIENADGEIVNLHEYGVNSAFADAETPVVTIVFTSWLNGHVPGWQEVADDIDELLDLLGEMRNEYSIPVDRHLYDYPESRLDLRHRPD